MSNKDTTSVTHYNILNPHILLNIFAYFWIIYHWQIFAYFKIGFERTKEEKKIDYFDVRHQLECDIVSSAFFFLCFVDEAIWHFNSFDV